jgi:hypothetical protein
VGAERRGDPLDRINLESGHPAGTPARRHRQGESSSGRYKGWPPSIDAAKIMRLSAELGPTAIAKRLGIAHSSVSRLLPAVR